MKPWSRDTTHRTIRFDLDSSILRLAADYPDHAAIVDLAGVYHNLLRCGADA